MNRVLINHEQRTLTVFSFWLRTFKHPNFLFHVNVSPTVIHRKLLFPTSFWGEKVNHTTEIAIRNLIEINLLTLASLKLVI